MKWENNQENHIEMFLYLMQVKAVLFAVISATSYYRFLSSTPFEITRDVCSQQLNYVHVKIQAYVESIWHVWHCVHNEEVRGESIP